MKDLVQIIKNNPGCIAVIDNDSWHIHPARPVGFNDWGQDEQEEWLSKNDYYLAQSDDEIKRGHRRGWVYGRDILEALATIAGIKIESA